MRFTCEREELSAALNIVQKAMPQRSTMNVLEGVFIQAKDNTITLRCSDLTLQIETKMAAQVEEEGSVVLGKLLFDVVRHLPQGPMQLISASDESMQVISNKSKTTIQAMPTDEFPLMPKLNTTGEVALPCTIFKDMIRQTIFSTAIDETKPILTGALLEITKEGINMVALDGYRLALRSYPMPCAKEANLVLPSKSLSEIARILPDDGEVVLTYGAGYASIDMGQTNIATQLLNGEFTKYRQIISREYQTRVLVEREDLLDSLERASIMAREARNNLIKMNIRQDKLIITSNSELGDVYEELPVVFEGHELEIAFNAKYLTDVLKVLNDKQVYINFNSNVSPATVLPQEADAFLYLVLPVRIYAN